MWQIHLNHRDTVMRFWGLLSCHSYAADTSCFRMIMYGPKSQGSVHNSWKLKMSHGLHTHPTCHQLSIFGMLWIDVHNSSRQYTETSHSHWRGVGEHSTGHNQQPDQLYVKEMCLAAWGKWLHQIRTGFLITPDTDWFSDPRPWLFFMVSVTKRYISVFPVMWNT